jgi:LacI family transcriptional regulator
MRPASSRITIKSVAQEAGVSITTVSLVLNNIETASIPPETRQRVLDAVKRLGYRRSASARQMRTHRSGLIGLITDIVATTPFAVEMIRGAQDIAWEKGKVLLIINTGGESGLDEAAVEVMLERQVEGIVYAAMFHRLVQPPEAIREVPVVLLDSFVRDGSLPSVVPDELGGASRAVDALVERGHRRIGLINLREDVPAGRLRRQAYLERLTAHGIVPDPEYIRNGDGETEGGYQQAQMLLGLPEAPTALFCANDRMAMGAYDAIKERGLRIPADVAVIGYDNQEIIAAHLRPALTTVQLPHYEMGRWAVQYLLRAGETAEQLPEQAVLPCPLVERESHGKSIERR